MDDAKLVAALWQRDEAILSQIERRFSRYLAHIAQNILGNAEDARECVNDALLAAWNGIPPAKPERLGLWLGRVVRRGAIDRYRRFHAQKRAPDAYAESLDELAEIVSGGESPEDAVLTGELIRSIERYLQGVSERARIAFVLRYYEADALSEIARTLGMTETAVKSMLWRTREGLRRKLLQEGFEL